MAEGIHDPLVLARLIMGIMDALHERDPEITQAVARSIESYRGANPDSVIDAALALATMRRTG